MISGVLLLALTTTAAAYDVRFRRIPNWLVVAGLAAGLAWAIASGAIFQWAEGLATGLALYLPLYLLHARGAGDVKLLAAAGSIVGPRNCVWLFFFTALAGGMLALVLVIAKGRVRRTAFNIGWMLRQLVAGRAPHKSNPELDVSGGEGLRMPHALAIAAGSVVLVLFLRAR